MAVEALSKKELRKKILALRRSMTENEVAKRSQVICRHVKEQRLFLECDNICLYMPVHNEVDVTLLLEPAWKFNKSVWLPKVSKDVMQFYSYDRNTPMCMGSFHIQEPDSQIRLIPDRKTLIVMPGAVFSENCDRIGYGGGYYDRYLEENPMCHTIAVCYDFQIVKTIPAEAHDKKPEFVVSDRKRSFLLKDIP